MSVTKKGQQKLPVNKKTPAPPNQTDQIMSRRAMIEKAAYHLAEQRGFIPGNDLQDWLEAERDLQSKLPPV